MTVHFNIFTLIKKLQYEIFFVDSLDMVLFCQVYPDWLSQVIVLLFGQYFLNLLNILMMTFRRDW